jgi:predicted permease
VRAVVSDGYFGTMGIPIRGGRGMEATDRPGAPPVAVVSETMARQFWPSSSPLGAHIRFTGTADSVWREVVGVVGDVRENPFGDPQPVAYISVWQAPEGGSEFLVRSAGDATKLIPVLRRELRALDPALPLAFPRTMRQVSDASLAGQRLPLAFTAAFAALAIVLSALGVYGVMAYAVTTRAREFGIRAALGSRRHQLLWLVLRQGLATTLLGAMVGLAVAGGLAGLLARLLFDVAPHDPLTFALAPLTVLVVSVAACLVPARRATLASPVDVLRTE